MSVVFDRYGRRPDPLRDAGAEHGAPGPVAVARDLRGGRPLAVVEVDGGPVASARVHVGNGLRAPPGGVGDDQRRDAAVRVDGQLADDAAIVAALAGRVRAAHGDHVLAAGVNVQRDVDRDGGAPVGRHPDAAAVDEHLTLVVRRDLEVRRQRRGHRDGPARGRDVRGDVGRAPDVAAGVDGDVGRARDVAAGVDGDVGAAGLRGKRRRPCRRGRRPRPSRPSGRRWRHRCWAPAGCCCRRRRRGTRVRATPASERAR